MYLATTFGRTRITLFERTASSNYPGEHVGTWFATVSYYAPEHGHPKLRIKEIGIGEMLSLVELLKKLVAFTKERNLTNAYFEFYEEV